MKNIETLRLFNSIQVEGNRAYAQDYKKSIKNGYILDPRIKPSVELLKEINSIVGLSGEKANASFHKSWAVIKDTPQEVLWLQACVHYMTTYGFEALGVYDESTVYIPHEELNIPGVTENVRLTLIKAKTGEEILVSILSLANSGIALAKETLDDIMEIVSDNDYDCLFVKGIKNHELRSRLYDFYDLAPENPTDYLRYVINKLTGESLLIKNGKLCSAIKEADGKCLDVLVKSAPKNLAEIFYRFKPLFLAFRTNSGIRKITNQIRRLANYHHKPMPKDYLNSLTAKIKNGEQILETDLVKALDRVNVFRKVRLANALKFRMNDPKSIVYKIRNGKGFATNFNKLPNVVIDNTLYQSYNIILNSICQNISEEIKKSTIYIPEYIQYALPTSEKQFTGNFPLGTCITTPKDMIVGVHWENQKGHRVDLDLSMINMKIGKIGWDSSYRTQDRAILFSGDMTNASLPNGASELFYVKIQNPSSFLLDLNYFNYSENMNVPFKIIVAQQKTKNITKITRLILITY